MKEAYITIYNKTNEIYFNKLPLINNYTSFVYIELLRINFYSYVIDKKYLSDKMKIYMKNIIRIENNNFQNIKFALDRNLR